MSELLKDYNFLLSYADRHALNDLSGEDRIILLQSIIRSGSTEQAWKALLELFASWKENNTKERAYSIAINQLESWPDEIRTINAAWKYLYRNEHTISSVAQLAAAIEILQREQNGNRELIAITGSSHVKHLKRLVVRKSDIYADGLRSLLYSTHLTSLTHLALESLVFTDTEFAALREAPGLASLTSLRLKNLGLNTKQLRKLLQFPLIDRMQHLELMYNTLDDESSALIANVLTSATGLPNLKELNLSNNSFTQNGINLLQQASIARKIKIIF